MVDFSLLGQGPQFKDVLSAFQSGQMARKESDTKNALALYATDPEGGISALNKVDPILGFKLRDDHAERMATKNRTAVISSFDKDPQGARQIAVQSGDPEAIKIWSSMNDEQKKQTEAVANEIGNTAYGILRAAPGDAPDAVQKRAAMLSQIKPDLIAIGIPAEKIDAVISNPTTDALNAVIAGSHQTMQLRSLDEDKRADNERAAGQAAEVARHNRAMEANQGVTAQASMIRAKKPAAGRSGGGKRSVTEMSVDELKALAGVK